MIQLYIKKAVENLKHGNWKKAIEDIKSKDKIIKNLKLFEREKYATECLKKLNNINNMTVFNREEGNVTNYNLFILRLYLFRLV